VLIRKEPTLRGESAAEPARWMIWSAGVSHFARGAASRCSRDDGKDQGWDKGLVLCCRFMCT